MSHIPTTAMRDKLAGLDPVHKEIAFLLQLLQHCELERGEFDLAMNMLRSLREHKKPFGFVSRKERP